MPPQIKGKLVRTLLDKATVVTQACLWSIPHDSGREDIALKIGRYKKPKFGRGGAAPEIKEPKSELTLNDEEFKALIEFVKENYEPFRHGAKAFIPLDTPYDKENAAQIRAFVRATGEAQTCQFYRIEQRHPRGAFNAP
jgi:hypothetical protein